MEAVEKYIFLADDDADDREIFEDAVTDIFKDTVTVNKAKDGKELMEILNKTVPPSPHVIFLDLNMPRKNGFECLTEIRQTKKLSNIPVVIYSTSNDKEYIDKVYRQGANYYVCKPADFSKLKHVISQVLSINWEQAPEQPPRDKFILSC